MVLSYSKCGHESSYIVVSCPGTCLYVGVNRCCAVIVSNICIATRNTTRASHAGTQPQLFLQHESRP